MTRRRQSTILLTLALVIGVSRMASAQDQFTCMRDTFGTMSVTPDVITEGFLRHVFLSWSVTVPQGCSGLVRIALNSSEVPASGTRLLYPTTTAYFQLQVRWYTSSTFQTIRIVPVLVVPRIRTDLLLQRSDGQVLIQLMTGVQSQGAAFPQVADPTWHIQGTGDFNRDGEADIVWRQPNGQVVIWLMRDAEVLYERTPASIGTLWRMGGIGDFNRDGHADILWRHSNGATRIWLMSNAALVTQTQPGARPPTVSIQGLSGTCQMD